MVLDEKSKKNIITAANSGMWSNIEPLLKELGTEILYADLDGWGSTILHCIATDAPDVSASGDAIEKIIAAGGDAIDINQPDLWNYYTPLYKARKFKKIHQTKALLKCGAELEMEKDPFPSLSNLLPVNDLIPDLSKKPNIENKSHANSYHKYMSMELKPLE